MKTLLTTFTVIVLLFLPFEESLAQTQQFGFSAESFSTTKKIAAAAGIIFGIGFTAFQRYRANQFIKSDVWKTKSADIKLLKQHPVEFHETEIVNNAEGNLVTIIKKFTTGSVTTNAQPIFYPWNVKIKKSLTIYPASQEGKIAYRVEDQKAYFGSFLPSAGSFTKALFTIGAFALIGSQMPRSPGK